MTHALVIVGTIVWIALQRLGYLELSELQRVAQRTIEQQRIMANNLSIRRACESLKRCICLSDVCLVLEEHYSSRPNPSALALPKMYWLKNLRGG